MLGILSFFSVGASYLVGLKVFSGYGIELKKLPSFSSWRPVEEMVWGLILGGVLYFGGKYTGSAIAEMAGFNIGILFLFVYLISGLSVMTYLFGRFNVPGLARILLYLLFAMQITFMMGLGLFDVWVDFRKKVAERDKREKNTG